MQHALPETLTSFNIVLGCHWSEPKQLERQIPHFWRHASGQSVLPRSACNFRAECHALVRAP
eukprot:690617-Alexandrium_andersonii.AAC.1